MIHFDLDGVCRSLTHHFKEPFLDYNQSVNGMGFCEYIDTDLSLLESAPPTPYLPIVREYPYINILTCQPEHWRKPTQRWIDEHLCRTNVIYFDSPKDKLAYLQDRPGDVLVEDYPFFESYKQIVLIDYPYNRCAVAPVRVRTPGELKEVIWGGGMKIKYEKGEGR